MIEFFFERVHRVLLVRYAAELTQADFQELDSLLADFVACEGTADTVIDFSNIRGRVEVADLVKRARETKPSVMAACRRVLVAPRDAVFGMMRAYSTHLELKGEACPHVVRSIAEAYHLLELEKPHFEPYAATRRTAAR